MGIVRFVVWITFSVVIATVLPWQKSPIMSTAQQSTTTLSDAGNSLTAAVADTYYDISAIKYQELYVLQMTVGLLANILGRSINGLGTTLDLANTGLGAARGYAQSGAGALVDATQSGLSTVSGGAATVGESVKSYGSNWIYPPSTPSDQTQT